MEHFEDFYQTIAKGRLSSWLNVVPKQLSDWSKGNQHDVAKKWLKTLSRIPEISPDILELKESVRVDLTTQLSSVHKKSLEVSLKKFSPWRKGPYHLYGIDIDSEWHSDWKWQRLLPHISSLKGRTVLDVGCGNGYHLWRMLGEEANFIIGIDPTLLFLFQFAAIKKLLGSPPNIHLLPLGIEQLPELKGFDTVFSMGVLYHRRSPLDHLIQLKNQLVDGGELVLETLVIDGDEQRVLLPQTRYAKMRNIYFIPSALALKNWLKKCGFTTIKIVDLCTTTTEEQRKTAWMTNESLEDFLDPTDKSKTIEGYPAPLRAVIVAKKPS